MHSYGWTVFRVAYLMRRGGGALQRKELWQFVEGGGASDRQCSWPMGNASPEFTEESWNGLPCWWYWTLQCRTSPHFSIFLFLCRKAMEKKRRIPFKTDIWGLTRTRLVLNSQTPWMLSYGCSKRHDVRSIARIPPYWSSTANGTFQLCRGSTNAQ